ncbi:MAG TPA: hypothetical protein VE777_19005 [Gaiellales bacterium]|jgi:hypothetical protein|nr:hypothetical protein [Gaiellales bacterium]
MIDVTGSIGGVAPRQTRSHVEGLLGPGEVVSTSTRHPKAGGTSNPHAGALSGIWAHRRLRAEWAEASVGVGIFTVRRRYHTVDSLRVGSTLAAARHEDGIRCTAQPSYAACQGGLGYEKPVTSFTVKDGRVVRVFVAAVAD